MEPTSAGIQSLGLELSVMAICNWAGFDQHGIEEYFDLFGMNPTIKPRLLAMFSKEKHEKSMDKWKINGEEAKPYVIMTATLVHKTARLLCGLKDEEALVGPSPTMIKDGWYQVGNPSSHAPVASASRTIRASSLIDPTDESVIAAASSDQARTWYGNYKMLKFGDPLIEREPTPDQICALHTRIISLGAEPYADFSLLTPHGRRMQKVLRHRSWAPQQDGTYQPVEVPGPEDWETWKACWDVYEVILLMLRWPPADGQDHGSLVATPIALEAYLQNFATLVKENPGCWHLCVTAEDRCRAEHFPRIARRLADISGYTPPWSDVFKAAADDDKYWDKEVRRPALRFLATRGGSASHSESGGAGSARGDRTGLRANHTEKKRKRERSAKPAGKGAGKSAGKGHGKGKGKGKGEHPMKDKKGLFITTREGEQVCFQFAKQGDCQGACNRAHVCQLCLQPHRNANCTKKA